MIELQQVQIIHSYLIEKFGGAKGVRDNGLLESAVSRPFASFEGKELYPTAIDKSSAIIESILINHPFIDGNKRTGYVLMRLILLNNRLDIQATEDEKYEFVIKIASGAYKFDEIRQWIQNKLIDNI